MSDSEQEQGKESRAPETKRFWIRVSLVILFILGVGNIFLQIFIIPKFEQIYKDALPGMQLPPLTEFIITARFALAIIDLGWPILGSFLVRLQIPFALPW